MKVGRFEVSALFITASAVIMYFDRMNLFVFVLLSAAAHEAGHIAAILLYGGKIEKIRASVFTIEIVETNHRKTSYLQDIITYMCGPAMNFCIAVLSSLIGVAYDSEFLLMFAGINLFLCCINLLPIPSLDGGCIIKTIFLWVRGL